MKTAIFLDKDGTIVPDLPFNTDPEKICFFHEVPEALHDLHQKGYLLIVISNQPGVARGYFPQQNLDKVSLKLQELAFNHGFRFDAFYYCIHDSEDKCTCRKPLPGLIFEASSQFDIDLKKSWMIGDILNDVEAGHAAACRSILVDKGNETEWLIKSNRIPDFICNKFKEAAKFIISLT